MQSLRPATNLKLIINSALSFTLAFNLVFFIQELFLALGKKWLGLKAILYHNNHNWEGSHPMETLAQGYGAAAILIVAVMAWAIVKMMKPGNSFYLFFLWFSFQGFAQGLPQLITATAAPDTDTGQAFTYLKIGFWAGVGISFVTMVLLVWIGTAYSKLFLQMAPGDAYVSNPYLRYRYLTQVVLLATLAGIVLTIPYRIMPWSRAMAPLIVSLISVPVVWLYGWKVRQLKAFNNPVNEKLQGPVMVFLVLLLIFFQVVLAKGLVI
ncbi:MAG: hypothetical protein IPP31_11350 [Chitinophagaceae bacterium]|nr:hypothetical protein [Chitinophagaceae bacterium]